MVAREDLHVFVVDGVLIELRLLDALLQILTTADEGTFQRRKLFRVQPVRAHSARHKRTTRLQQTPAPKILRVVLLLDAAARTFLLLERVQIALDLNYIR